jgi:DUF4097 and DUF4098 domain-containing protein YvlB
VSAHPSPQPQRSQRNSIFTALLLIVIGAIFLFDRFYPSVRIGHLIRLYWPVLIIVWGIAKLIDHFAAREGQRRPPILSGGEAALLVILAFVLAGFAAKDWFRDRYPYIDTNIDLPPFDQSYSRSQQLPQEVIPADAHVEVDTLRGNIVIRPGSDLQISGTKSSWGYSEPAANDAMKQVNIVVERTSNGYRVHPLHQDGFGGRVGVDLDLQVPKTVSVSADTNRGDIRVSGIAGKIDAHTGNGSVEIHQAGSDVSAALQAGDARISQVGGSLRVSGRGNSVEISDVSGDAMIDGAFVVSTRLRNIAKTVRCVSPWFDVTVEHLNGQLESDEGDIRIADAAGAAKVATHNQDVELDDVAGQVYVSNAHGDIKINYSNPPRNQVNVSNDSGNVELKLPARSNFQISAISRSGEIENDFDGASLRLIDDEGNGKLNGQFGTGGPVISISTSYGTIYLRKSG